MQSLAQLREALADVDAAVECCLAVAVIAPGIEAETRQAAADVAVTDYEAADAVVEALLSAIIAAGGCPGLLDTVEAACRRAGDRVTRVFVERRAMADPRPGDKAVIVAQHAYDRAEARDARVRAEIVTPYWQRLAERVEASDAAA